MLKGAALIKSVRDPTGGYELCRSPSDTHLLEVLETREGSLSFAGCVQDPAFCDRTHSCAFNEIWKTVTQGTGRILAPLSLWDVLAIDSIKKEVPIRCSDP